MSLPKNIQAYSDIEKVLISIGERQEARIKFSSERQAKIWIRRMYYFRTLLRKINKELYADLPGYSPTTPYDEVVLKVEGLSVLYSIRVPNCTVEDADGNEIKLITGKSNE